ncbi:hypothetical protein [Alistipes sp.]|uniref:hypothetical protein n=1 Tax=Alistipes sp. TaxID=1872444 RepID=UPI003AEFE56A
MSFWYIAFRLFSITLSVVGLGGAALLLRQSLRNRGDRARRVLAFILLMWGLPSLPDCFRPLSGPWLPIEPLGALSLIIGNLYVIISLLYPLERARPGWITPRRLVLLFTPFVLCSGLYFLVLALLGQPMLTLHGSMDMLLHFGEFNVWYRLVLYLTICFYLAYLFLSTSVSALELSYRDSAILDRRCIAWLRFYGAGMACVTLAYLGVMLYGTLQSLVIHRMTTTLFFGTFALNAVFNRPLHIFTPAPEKP